MKTTLILSGLFFFTLLSNVYSESIERPNRRSRSSIDENVNISTFIASRDGGDEGMSNVNLSSGVIGMFGVFVSSPGVNSELSFYNNRLAGDVTNHMDTVQTDTYGWIPYKVEATNGLIFTSTCTGCPGPWSMPDLCISLERKR